MIAMQSEAAPAPSLQEALDMVEALPLERRWELVDLIRRRLVEARRQEIARNAAEARSALAAGRLPRGSVDDLLVDAQTDEAPCQR